jgi:hypothetical protein
MAKTGMWPTPKAGGLKLRSREINDATAEEVRSMRSGHGGQLSPDWAEKLMGWPKGYTSLEPLEQPAPTTMTPWGDDWEEGVPRVAKGVPDRTARLKAIGNGQVPQCAAVAWEILTSGDIHG